MIEAELNKSLHQNTILLGMVCEQLYRNEWLECQICVYHSIFMCLKLGLYQLIIFKTEGLSKSSTVQKRPAHLAMQGNSENFCPHNGQLPFLRLSASVRRYEISYDLRRARRSSKKALIVLFFFMRKKLTSHKVPYGLVVYSS